MKTGFLKVWCIPVLLAVLSMVGLLAALIGDGAMGRIVMGHVWHTCRCSLLVFRKAWKNFKMVIACK